MNTLVSLFACGLLVAPFVGAAEPDSYCARVVRADIERWTRTGTPANEEALAAFTSWAAACKDYMAPIGTAETAGESDCEAPTLAALDLCEGTEPLGDVNVHGLPGTGLVRKLCDGTGMSVASWRWGVEMHDQFHGFPDLLTTGKWDVFSGGAQNNVVIKTRGVLGSATAVTMSLGPLTVPSDNDVAADCTGIEPLWVSLDAIMSFRGRLDAPGLRLSLTAEGILCTVPC